MFAYFCLIFSIGFLLKILSQTTKIITEYQKLYSRKLVFQRYDQLLSVLDLAKDVAYRKTFQEDLLIQASSGYRLNDVETHDIGKQYVKLTLDCCGPAVTKDLAEIFGDYDSLCMFLMHGFVTKSIETEAQLLSIATDDNGEPDDVHKALLNNDLRGGN